MRLGPMHMMGPSRTPSYNEGGMQPGMRFLGARKRMHGTHKGIVKKMQRLEHTAELVFSTHAATCRRSI
jgi:hypothetical protein